MLACTLSEGICSLEKNEDTKLDRVINRGKNSNYLVPILLGVVVVGGLASFLDDVCIIRKHIGFPCAENGSGLSPDVKAVLEDRADDVTAWLDRVVAEIDMSNFSYQQENNCVQAITQLAEESNPSDPQAASRCDAAGKETFDLMISLRNTKGEFIALHQRHLEHLTRGNDLAAHETAKEIFSIIEGTKETLSTAIVGFDGEADTNVSYLNGFPDLVLSLRHERSELVLDPYIQCAENPNEVTCQK